MGKWSNEEEARKEIRSLVEAFYHEFREPSNTKEFHEGDRIGYGGRVYDEKEMQSLVDSALDFWLTTGRFSDLFEKDFAKWIGVKFCHLVNSGSSANLIAFSVLTSPELKERQIKKGDEVITVACGFPTTVTPILQYGAVPVFVDVTIPQYNIDVSKLEEAYDEKKTKAVMIAHTLGNPFDLSAVKAFCDTVARRGQLRCPGVKIYYRRCHEVYRYLGRHRNLKLLSSPSYDDGRGRCSIYKRSPTSQAYTFLQGLGARLHLPERP